MGLKSAMSAHILSKNSELRFLSVIHNAGVGGSRPPVATKISIKINLLCRLLSVFLVDRNLYIFWATSGQPQRKKI